MSGRVEGPRRGRAATTRTSARSSPESNRSPAHSAIAASRLNESRGQQHSLETSGAELSSYHKISY
jgi:hypothetical protein